jgi:hypothetical protein
MERCPPSLADHVLRAADFSTGSAAAPSSDQSGLSNSLASETEVDR